MEHFFHLTVHVWSPKGLQWYLSLCQSVMLGTYLYTERIQVMYTYCRRGSRQTLLGVHAPEAALPPPPAVTCREPSKGLMHADAADAAAVAAEAAACVASASAFAMLSSDGDRGPCALLCAIWL